MFSESQIGVEEVDYEELGLYLALTMEAKDMKKLGITEVCPEENRIEDDHPRLHLVAVRK